MNALEWLAEQLAIEPGQVVYVASAVFIAGIVRGFSGFALSALIMASLVLVIPTVELIPVCVMLELVAGISMLRGSVRQAEMKMVWVLVLTSMIGLPLGLYMTTTLPTDITRMVALGVILILAVAQMARVRASLIETRPALVITGIITGLATGLASVGGMVVALYVLARRLPVVQVRASLVMYLLLSLLVTGTSLILFGMVNEPAIMRALWLTPLVLLGIVCGSALFRPSLETAYRQICLALLSGMAVFGLLRELVT